MRIETKQLRRSRRYVSALCCGLLLFPLSVFAFKVDTHVFIAQEVINDLEKDNQITLKLGNKTINIDVNPDLAQAIRDNPAMYRMGNIGPDAFPDIFTGQFVVHPGADGTMKTDEWLSFLLRSSNMTPADRAFIAGYFGHAASDTFAHTYVNHYSGDIFNITDELKDYGKQFFPLLNMDQTNSITLSGNLPTTDGGTTVPINLSVPYPELPDYNHQILNDVMVEEERHIELEKYIGLHTPPPLDSNGNVIGEPEDLLDMPSEFLRDRLIFNDEVAAYNKNGSAYHLYLVHELRRNLIDLYNLDLNILNREAVKGFLNPYCSKVPTCKQITDDVADEFIAFGNQLTSFVRDHGELAIMQDKANELFDALAKVAPISVDIQAKMDQALLDIHGKTAEIAARQAQVAVKVHQEYVQALDVVDATQVLVNEAVSVLNQANAQLSDIAGQVSAKVAEVSAQVDYVNSLSPTVEVCVEWNFIVKIGNVCVSWNTVPNPAYYAAKEVLDQLQAQLNNLQAAFNAMQTVVNTATDVYNKQANALSQAKDAMNSIVDDIVTMAIDYGTAQDALQAAIDIKGQLTEEIASAYLTAIGLSSSVFNVAIDFIQQSLADLDPLRAALRNWIQDIEEGMRQYILTSGDVIREFMKEQPDPMKHISHWLDCWGKAIVGEPSIIGTTECKVSQKAQEVEERVRNEIDRINERLDRLEARLAALTPITEYIYNFKKNLEEKVKRKATDLAFAFAEALTGAPIRRLMDLLGEKASAERLDTIFGQDLSSDKHKGLLEIPDMSSRVNSSMQLKGIGLPTPYDRDYLDSDKFTVVRNAIVLSKLALLDHTGLQQLAEAAGVFYSNRYQGPLFPADVKNILIDAIGSIDGNHQWMSSAPNYPRRNGMFPPIYHYGYSAAGNKGFRIWQDCDARDKLFRQLFTTVLIPGLETPDAMQPPFPAIISADSSYLKLYNPSVTIPYPNDTWNDTSCGGSGGPTVAKSELVLSNVSRNSNYVYLGGNLPVTGVIYNRTNVASSEKITVSFYLSDDTIYDTSDTLLGTYVVSNQIGGRSKLTFNLNVYIPLDVEYKSPNSSITLPKRVIAVLDRINLIPERMEATYGSSNNNAIVLNAGQDVPIYIGTNADIAVVNINTPVQVSRSGSMSVSGSITNSGTSTTNDSPAIGVYLSTDAQFDDADILIGSVNAPQPLAPNEVLNFSITDQLPPEVAAGSYHVLVVADPFDTIEEVADPDMMSPAGTTAPIVKIGRNNVAYAGTITLTESDNQILAKLTQELDIAMATISELEASLKDKQTRLDMVSVQLENTEQYLFYCPPKVFCAMPTTINSKWQELTDLSQLQTSEINTINTQLNELRTVSRDLESQIAQLKQKLQVAAAVQ